MKRFLIVLFIVLFPCTCLAQHLNLEKFYQTKWCNEHKGRMEVVLEGGGRADCITDTNAVEFDFAEKWAESVGQSLYYSLVTGKKAGIVLIIESDKDLKFWFRLNSTIAHFKLPIDVWQVSP